MIASITGVLADREGETVVVQTDSGVGYAVTVPLGVFERLPPRGARVSLHTELVVREDGWALFGFDPSRSVTGLSVTAGHGRRPGSRLRSGRSQLGIQRSGDLGAAGGPAATQWAGFVACDMP